MTRGQRGTSCTMYARQQQISGVILQKRDYLGSLLTVHHQVHSTRDDPSQTPPPLAPASESCSEASMELPHSATPSISWAYEREGQVGIVTVAVLIQLLLVVISSSSGFSSPAPPVELTLGKSRSGFRRAKLELLPPSPYLSNTN